MQAPPLRIVIDIRARHRRIWRVFVFALLSALAGLFVLTLLLGQSFTPPGAILRDLLGEDVPGVAFTVGQLRLPRAVMSILAGLSFGLGGVAFQLMLRNPLASPDIIGISWGASAAAVFAIVVLSLKGPVVSIFAVAAGLAVALTVYGLSFRNGVAGTRLILVGIAVSAMLESFIAYTLSIAPAWNLQEALRWLTGSVNGARLGDALPLLVALTVFGGLLIVRARDLEALRLGDDMAAALGVRVGRTRVLILIAAVGMIAAATAVTGPIAFVAFLSGPIARALNHGRTTLLGAGLVGAVIVLGGDHAGAYAFADLNLPVGVVTGAFGAPFLLWLLARGRTTRRAA